MPGLSRSFTEGGVNKIEGLNIAAPRAQLYLNLMIKINNPAMKLKRIILLPWLCGMLIFTARAQDAWSLERCINYALENNIQYKREKLRAETTSNLFLNAKMDLLPNANGFANASQNWGTTFSYDKLQYVDQNNLDGNFGLRLQMDVFRGFEKINAISQYKYNLLSNMQDVEKMEDNITLEIVASYLQILLNQELYKLALNQLDVTSQQVVRTGKLVEVGNQPRGKLLEMQAQEALEKSNLTAARNDLALSYLTLTQLLFLDSAGGFQVEVPADLMLDETSVLQQPAVIYDQALTIMPGIRSAEYMLKSEEKYLASMRGRRYPYVTAQFLGYTRFNELAVHPTLYDNDPNNDIFEYPYTDQIADFRYKQFTFSLVVPLFNNWYTNTQISNAKVSVSDARLGLDQARLDLYRIIQQAHANALAALENFRSRQEAVMSQQEAFDYAEQKFEVGLVSSVDYNIAKNNLTRAQSDLLQSKYQFLFRSKILDFYSGKPIWF